MDPAPIGFLDSSGSGWNPAFFLHQQTSFPEPAIFPGPIEIPLYPPVIPGLLIFGGNEKKEKAGRIYAKNVQFMKKTSIK
jgi:hypothetical protein